MPLASALARTRCPGIRKVMLSDLAPYYRHRSIKLSLPIASSATSDPSFKLYIRAICAGKVMHKLVLLHFRTLILMLMV